MPSTLASFTSGTLSPSLSILTGLVPHLQAAGASALLPIYVDSLVGADWEQGPRRALNQALRAATSEAGSDGEALALGRIEERSGRVPLIIFDQFDDYQARYRDKFLRARTWIQPPQLLEENLFWRELAELLRLGKIHLLIITCADTAAGLASARFAPAVTFNLEPIGKQYVGQIFDQLLAGETPPAIEDPDYGWLGLRARLSADLEQGGAVLPQQLKVVLLGLSTLPKGILTVAAYERVGGARRP